MALSSSQRREYSLLYLKYVIKMVLFKWDTFGFHTASIVALKKEWESLPDSSRVREGSLVFDALLAQKKQFYFSDKYFDEPCECLEYTLKWIICDVML